MEEQDQNQLEGQDFSQYHDLFGKIYSEVYGSIDVLAEEIRGMDAYTPGSFSRFMQLTQIPEDNSIPNNLDMARRLLNDIQIIQDSIMKAYHLAEDNMHHNYSNLMAERQDAFKKHAWMLRSSVK